MEARLRPIQREFFDAAKHGDAEASHFVDKVVNAIVRHEMDQHKNARKLPQYPAHLTIPAREAAMRAFRETDDHTQVHVNVGNAVRAFLAELPPAPKKS